MDSFNDQDEKKIEPRKWFRRSFFFSIIFFVLSYLQISRIENPSKPNTSLLALLLLAMSLGITMFGFSLSTHPIQLNMALYWYFQIVFFGLVPLVLLFDPEPYYLAKLSSINYFEDAIWLLFFWNLTSMLVQFKTLQRIEQDKNLESSMLLRIDLLKVQKRIKIVVILYCTFLPITISQVGGIHFLLRDVRLASGFERNSISQVAIFESFLYGVPMVVLLIYFILKKNGIAILNTYIIFGFGIWILLLSNPIGNPRQTTLFLILPFIFVYLKTSPRFISFFFLILSFFFLYSANLVNRYSGSFQLPKMSLLSRDGDFDAFAQLTNGIRVTSEGGFTFMRQITASFFFFVPRSVWDNKPFDTGIEIARMLGLHFQNLSSPLILESYVNARYIGIFLFSLVFVSILTKVDLRTNFSIIHQVLAAAISGMLFIILRGSLLQATGRFVFTTTLIWLILRNLESKKVND